ncbi:MAG: hypothetical protein K0Q59_3833 [Paenibacillus sp.]|jgi:AraC-like DNA-binding protein|nr:hypothetical protein [Paenibacillus sp.]
MLFHSLFLHKGHAKWTLKESVTENDTFILVESGSLIYIVDGNRIPLTKGDVLYIPQGHVRSAICDPPHTHHMYGILFKRPRSLEQPVLPMLEQERIQHLHTRNFDYLKQRCSLLVQHWLGQMPHYHAICAGIFTEIVGIVNREMEDLRFPVKKKAMITTLQQYILNHYREPIRMELLAALVDRSPNYITTTFREITGLSPIEYLNRVRVASARELLLNTHFTIGQIADMTGFCDQSYFNRVYKKVMGYPPSKQPK